MYDGSDVAAVLGGLVSAGIRSRVEGDKHTARNRVPSNCRGLDFAVEWHENEADAELKGDHWV
jgi:hypothetical protein